MEWVETTGRTVEEAKEAALDQLGVDESDAEFEILEEPKFGLFGRLRSGARVRGRVRPTRPRPKDEHRDRRGRRRSGGAAGPGSSAAAVTTDDAEAVAVGGSTEVPAAGQRTRANDSAAQRTDLDVNADSDGDHTDGGDTTPAPSSGPRRSGGPRGRGPQRPATPDSDDNAVADGIGAAARPRPGAVRPASAAPGREKQESHDDSRSRGGGMEVSLDQQGTIAAEFLKGLVDRLDLDADLATARPDEDTVEINLQGDDLGMLIGAKGATLLAIQDLTRTVVQRRTGAGNGRLVVDVAGYRRKRKEALERFARRLAEEVQETGTQRVLEAMSAADRKIVHDAANQFEGVSTVSEGEDPNRRVVILPAPR